MIIPKGAPQFDALVRELIWNARLPEFRSPDMIAQPKSAEDVAAAILFAKERGLKVALRSSGHNYQGAALRGDGMMIDLGGLDTIEIDAVARRALVGAGVKGGRLIKELAEHGLAFPIGHCADVALGGYILSGGIGWNYGEWGPACASIREIELVTAAGEIIVANEREHADLFWAAKGAGLMFPGAVTWFELVLHTPPPATLAYNAVFEAGSAPLIAPWLSEAALSADPTTEIICLVGPDVDTGTPSITIRAIASGSSIEHAVQKLGQLRQRPNDVTLLASVEETQVPFDELPKFSAMPNGKRVAADQIWSNEPLGDLLMAVHHLAGVPEKSSAISLTALGGGAAMPRQLDGAGGLFTVPGRTSAGVYALWNEPADDALHLNWVADAMEALRPFKSGRYIGETDLFSDLDRIADCFGRPAREHLQSLQQKYGTLGFSSFPTQKLSLQIGIASQNPSEQTETSF